MIGSHLSATCLKGGEINQDEVKASGAFFDKCIPMLEMQLTMVRLTLEGKEEDEQTKYANSIATAEKCCNLLRMLQGLNREAEVGQSA